MGERKMIDPALQPVLRAIADYTVSYRNDACTKSLRPPVTLPNSLSGFDEDTPAKGAPLETLYMELLEKAQPGLAAIVHPAFFGWVIGATHPAGLMADWLTTTWGQNVGNHDVTPSAAAAEHVSAKWLLDLLGLPAESSVGFVTGATMANFTGLSAARGEVLRRAGWDSDEQGLFGAPPVHVFIGEEAHATVYLTLRYLGFGNAQLVRIPSDSEGRMIVRELQLRMEAASGPSIVVAQAGHIHSGAFDDFEAISRIAQARDAWLHVDGAFGLWARAAPDRFNLVRGIDLADSWAVDGHKWLQTPHDSGYAIVRDPVAHARAMRMSASYLPESGENRNPSDFVPELSRRARGFATWAMIKALGRDGIAEMVERHCKLAQRLATRLSQHPGIFVLNDVCLNQVAVRFGSVEASDESDRLTRAVIEELQRGGDCYLAGAIWRGGEIMRVSVINHNTTERDIDNSCAAIEGAVGRLSCAE